MSNFAFLQELLNTVADQSRNILPKSLFRDDPSKGLQELVQALMSGRGEASGVAIAHQLLRHYDLLDPEMKLVFFNYVAEVLQPDSEAISKAAEAYVAEPSASHLRRLQRSVDSPTQEFFRRLNMAPGGTAKIVAMREDLHEFMAADPTNDQLRTIDNDLRHLLQSWFNRGFLVQRRIDWNTPATILDKIIDYEAVHEITGWDDLRRRLDPADRRCFAFFHPSMVDEPLIFVQVALTDEIPADIASVLEMEPPDGEEGGRGPSTAVFYSISNCQEGLRGISFGNFLIKQVVEELSRECPTLRTFVTLSPVPGFAKWVENLLEEDGESALDERTRAAITAIKVGDWQNDSQASAMLAPSVQALAAMYFLNEKNARGQPIDPVARFHLGNGARLERINWPADLSPRGLQQAHGVMVNYLYVLGDIEKNHEAFANDGEIAASRAVRILLRGRARTREMAGAEKSDASDEAVPALTDANSQDQSTVTNSEQ